MGAPDRRRTFTPLPISTFGEYDSVGAIKSVLRQLRIGMFRTPAQMVDNFAEDDRIDAVTRTRVGALMGSELDIKPVDESRKAVQVAEMLGGIEDGPGEWDRMFPPGVVSEVLRQGVMLNFGLAEILWTSERNMWWPRLKFWDSQFVRWDEGTTTYRLMTTTGEIDLPRLDQNPVGDGRWFIWNPFGYQYAWRRGMIRGLASKYMMRQWDQRDWARYCEVHGLPMRKAIVPGGGGDAAAEDAFFEAVKNVCNEPTVMVPQGADGNKYDISLVEAQSKTWETFQAFKAALDIDIAVMMLGQNLSTEASGGGLGGGEVAAHRQVQREKLREDTAITVAFRDQVLVPFCQFNFGDPSLAPIPVYQIDPPEDAEQKAKGLKMFGEALRELRSAGIVNERVVLEEGGVPTFTEEELQAQAEAKAAEEAAKKAIAAAEAAAGSVVAPDGAASFTKNSNHGDEQPAALASRRKVRRVFVSANVVQRYEFAGLPIAVEYAAGSKREFEGGDTITMTHDYGFIEGHLGKDGDELDCYVGPDESATEVYVVHQLKAPQFTALDEDKCFLGFTSEADARAAYLAHRGPDGEKAISSIDTIPVETFKDKLMRRRGGGIIRASAIAVLTRRQALVEMDHRARERARFAGKRVAVRRS